MIIFAFDTETTDPGIPNWNEPSESPNQPHLAEVAALLFDDETGEVIEHYDTLIRPDGWNISMKLSDIHGITMERALAEGIDEREAVEQVLGMWSRASLRIAHAENFDTRMFRISIKRMGLTSEGMDVDTYAEHWSKAPRYCTMRKAQGLMKMQRVGCGGKFPTLAEAHQHFVGEPLEGAHEALFDAFACARLYMAMEKGYVPESLLIVPSQP